MKNNLKHILYDIPETNMSVTDTGKLIKAKTGEEITNEVIKYKGKSTRTKTLILTVYRALGREDLYPTVTDVWYEFYKDYTHYIDYSLISFCREYGINYDHAWNAIKNNRDTSCGWTILRKSNETLKHSLKKEEVDEGKR
ncbi:hypothetical protein CGI18_07175 [Vibrio parahaemolyticus]|uniref:hypothetical protein n=1 Tax=Vibrio parahaemolyticus TaxID=670 RepID=UPI00111D9442|nr:hypothetical protein [Vibrio parahaemolyticus]TOK48266.1 hypothetical protein CGI18_07175 [Vibrio parahaemolyticus]